MFASTREGIRPSSRELTYNFFSGWICFDQRTHFLFIFYQQYSYVHILSTCKTWWSSCQDCMQNCMQHTPSWAQNYAKWLVDSTCREVTTLYWHGWHARLLWGTEGRLWTLTSDPSPSTLFGRMHPADGQGSHYPALVRAFRRPPATKAPCRSLHWPRFAMPM